MKQVALSQLSPPGAVTHFVCQVRVEQQGSGALETTRRVIPHQKEWQAHELCLPKHCPAPKCLQPSLKALLSQGQPVSLQTSNCNVSKNVWFSLIKIILQEICFSSCIYTLLATDLLLPLSSWGCHNLVKKTGHLVICPTATTVQLCSHFDLGSDTRRKRRRTPWPWHPPRRRLLCTVTKGDTEDCYQAVSFGQYRGNLCPSSGAGACKPLRSNA